MIFPFSGSKKALILKTFDAFSMETNSGQPRGKESFQKNRKIFFLSLLYLISFFFSDYMYKDTMMLFLELTIISKKFSEKVDFLFKRKKNRKRKREMKRKRTKNKTRKIQSCQNQKYKQEK